MRINTMYSRTYWDCKRYLSQEKPDFEITITDQDLIKEQLITFGDTQRHMGGYLESTVVYRKIVEEAINYNAFMIHGAAIAVDGKGYIFSGKSGVGKTTHIQKWLLHNPDTIIINGDKPLIRCINNTFFVCGTPWSGKERMNTNAMVPLNGIAFMTRNEDISVTKIGLSQALPFFLSQVYFSQNTDKMQMTLSLLGKMEESVHFYDFQSNNLKDDCYQIVSDALLPKC